VDEALYDFAADIEAAGRMLGRSVRHEQGQPVQAPVSVGWFSLAVQYNRAVFWARRDAAGDEARARADLEAALARAEADVRRHAKRDPAFEDYCDDEWFKDLFATEEDDETSPLTISTDGVTTIEFTPQ
jgi:hypothetical protein